MSRPHSVPLRHADWKGAGQQFEGQIETAGPEQRTFDLSAQYGLSYDMSLDGTILSGRSPDQLTVLARRLSREFDTTP